MNDTHRSLPLVPLLVPLSKDRENFPSWRYEGSWSALQLRHGLFHRGGREEEDR